MPRSWRYDQVVWGVTLCDLAGCALPADGLLDGEALCVDHAGDVIDRQIAAELNRAAVDLMPALEDR